MEKKNKTLPNKTLLILGLCLLGVFLVFSSIKRAASALYRPPTLPTTLGQANQAIGGLTGLINAVGGLFGGSSSTTASGSLGGNDSSGMQGWSSDPNVPDIADF